MKLFFNLLIRQGVYGMDFEDDDELEKTACYSCNGLIDIIDTRISDKFMSISRDYECFPFKTTIHGVDAENYELSCAAHKPVNLKRLI